MNVGRAGLGRTRTADVVGMKRNAHHAAALRALAVECVELILDHLQVVGEVDMFNAAKTDHDKTFI